MKSFISSFFLILVYVYAGVAQNKEIDFDKATKYIDDGNYTKAITYLDKAIELQPESSVAYALRGIANGLLKNYNQALSDLDKSISLDPNNGNVYSTRATIYNEKKMYIEEIADRSNSLGLNPEDFDEYFHRAKAYFEIGYYEKAIDDLNIYLELQPKDDNALIFRCLSYAYIMNYSSWYDDHFEILIRAVNGGLNWFSNHQADYDILSGTDNIYKCKYDEAIKDFYNILHHIPESAHANYFLAIINFYKGDFNSANNYIDKAIALNNANIFYKYLKGIIYYQYSSDKKEEAFVIFKKIVESADSSLAIYAFSKFYLYSPDEAITISLNRIENSKDNYKALNHEYYHIAILYSLMNNQNEALRYLELALQNGYKVMECKENINYDFFNIKGTPAFQEMINKY